MTPVVAAAAGHERNGVSPKNEGRGSPEAGRLFTNSCCCQRPKGLVFCRGCGYHTLGRIQLKCAFHPRVMFLLDMKKCPKCKSALHLDEQSQ